MEEKTSGDIYSDIFDMLECSCITLVVLFIVFSMIFRLCVVDGPSMENTLYDNQKVMVTDIFGDPERGDIVVFHENKTFGFPLVKRVIATGGEWIDIQDGDGKLIIKVADNENMENAIDLTDEYATYKSNFVSIGRSCWEYPMQVPEGCIFVMGDNRNNSSDSRLSLGCVDLRCVIGKLVIRLTPLSEFGTVD